MRLFAEERKLRTFEFLLTSPVGINEIVAGKFMSVFLVFLGLLGLTGLMPLMLALFCDFDWYPVLTGYLGLVLLGALFLSVGVLASALTENQIVAAFVSIGLLLVLVAPLRLGLTARGYGHRTGRLVSVVHGALRPFGARAGRYERPRVFFQQSGLDALFGSPSRGLGTVEMNLKTIPLGVIGVALAAAGAIGYSLVPEKLWLVGLLEGAALLCLIIFVVVHFSGLKAFSARRSTRVGANSLLMILLFVGILVIVNFLAARHSIRWDLSENQNFSLAPQTHRLLRSLPRDVTVTVFTREKDPGYQSYKERLDSYRQASSKISVEFVDPERQPKIAQQYGITQN